MKVKHMIARLRELDGEADVYVVGDFGVKLDESDIATGVFNAYKDSGLEIIEGVSIHVNARELIWGDDF